MTEKELLFCEYFAECQNAKDAAARAGYKIFPERAARKLLRSAAVRNKCEKLINAGAMPVSPLSGLRKLAFASVSDAIKLVAGENSRRDGEIEKMDFFAVSEIKRGANGAVEIKFFDRLKALALLCELENDKTADCSAKGFFDAISKGAEAIGLSERDDEK